MHTATILTAFTGKAAEAFCWMLVHSLWQGLLFTIITGGVMLLTRKSSAVLRYNIMCVLLFLFIATCAGTFVWQFTSMPQPVAGLQSATGAATVSLAYIWFQKLDAYFRANTNLVLIIWCIVFLAKCVKMVGGVVYTQRIRHYKTYQPPAEWQHKIATLCKQLHLRKNVQLLQSGIVKIPVVIGHLKPIVFIPLGLLTSMPAGEIEAVLLHELAHIRRNDYFVNILQVMIENVFFFNPALLWMSAIIREERENCCDDVAVAQTQSKKQFVQALISFKEHALYANKYATAFPAKKNQLLHRVTRIISNSNKTLTGGEKAFFITSFLLLAGLTLAVTGETVLQKPLATKQAATQQTGNKPAGAAAWPPANNEAFVSDSKPIDAENHTALKSSKSPVVIEVFSKTITIGDDEAGKLSTNMLKPVKQLTDVQMAELDRQQAERDRLQADADRKQADLDRLQAEEDRKQAIKDQEQARLDQIQAEKDRQQSLLDQQQAETERKEAEIERLHPVA